jgi:hypothetical protein
VTLEVGESVGDRRVGGDDRTDRRRDGGARPLRSPALTVYDMAKAVDKEMRIADVVLVEKTKEASSERLRGADGVRTEWPPGRVRIGAVTPWTSCWAARATRSTARRSDERDEIAAAIRELAASAVSC